MDIYYSQNLPLKQSFGLVDIHSITLQMGVVDIWQPIIWSAMTLILKLLRLNLIQDPYKKMMFGIYVHFVVKNMNFRNLDWI